MLSITYNDISPWAFLRDSLIINSCGPKIGLFRHDEHYERTKNFYDCLIKLRERDSLEFDPEIFQLSFNGISYVDVQTRILDYAEKRKYNYLDLLEKLIEDIGNILKEKTVKNLETLDEIIPYMKYPNFVN